MSQMCFADDIYLISEDVEEAQDMLNALNGQSEVIGVKDKIAKTQFMTTLALRQNITLNDTHL